MLCMAFTVMVIIIGFTVKPSDTHESMLQFLSIFASVIAAIAGLVTAIAAFFGVSTWKKQLKYGKHISIIWECMEEIRTFHDHYINWYVTASTKAFNSKNFDAEKALISKYQMLDSTLERMKSKFNSLDQIVVKNDWQWRNYAGAISLQIKDINSIFSDEIQNPSEPFLLSINLAKKNKALKEYSDSLESKLIGMESDFKM